MRKKYQSFVSFTILMIVLMFYLMSCTPQQETMTSTESLNNDQLALRTLVNFLDNLDNNKFDQAAQIYGGTYETMTNQNPGINSNDYSALLRNACTINGAQCLQMKSASLESQISDKEFVFKVDFLNSDGTLFEIGPCCGENETDAPPKSAFNFTVIKKGNNEFVVLDMPPYAP